MSGGSGPYSYSKPNSPLTPKEWTWECTSERGQRDQAACFLYCKRKLYAAPTPP